MGTIAELQGKPDRLYPLLWLSNEGGSLADNYKVDNIRLTMFGRVIAGEEGQDDDASEIEVLSDMQSILLDFLNYFHQNHSQEYVTDKAAQLEHFTERTNDRTAGYSCVLELKQFYDWNKCQIPQSGATIPPTVDGLTLYDFCDQSVIDRLTDAQIACLEAEFGQCADATITVNSTPYGTAPSGGSENVEVVSGVMGTTPRGSLISGKWFISDSAFQINGVNKDSISPETTFNLTVRLNGVADSGSYNPATDTLDLTSTAPNASIEFYSDAGLTIPIVSTILGATVYVKVTTNIAATAYDFLVPQRDGAYLGVNQIGDNVYEWTVDAIGAIYFAASATDGTDSPFTSEAITSASTYILDTYTTATAAFSVRKLRSDYLGYCMTVRRSSDNATINVGFVNDMLDVASILAFVGTGNGFVTTWYDQSTTAGNATQATANAQPLIVSNGVLNEMNDIPAMLLGGSNASTTYLTLSKTVKTLFSVWRKHGNNIQYVTLLGWSGDYVIQAGGSTPTLLVGSPGGNISSTLNNFRLNQLSVLLGTAASGRVRANGTQVGTGTSSDTQVLQRIGINTFSTSRYFLGEFSELITFPDDQSANFAAIEADQMRYFKL